MLPLRRLTLAWMAMLGLCVPLAAGADVTVHMDIRWPAQLPELVEFRITQPIEAAMIRLPSLMRMQSRTFEGRSQIQLQFEDVDAASALLAVHAALNTVAARLPTDASQPTVRIAHPPVPGWDTPAQPRP
jgi:multidrug efflux pump subunit AcrB